MRFNLEPFWEASLAIQLHIAFGLFAVFAGAYVLFRKKGGKLHRYTGWSWVVAMAIVAFSGFFINQIRTIGPFSPIHLLSVWVPIGLTLAVLNARKRNFVAHRGYMIGLYSGLIFAAVLTFARGLTMSKIFLTEHFAAHIPSTNELPGGTVGFVMVGALLVAVLVWLIVPRKRFPIR